MTVTTDVAQVPSPVQATQPMTVTDKVQVDMSNIIGRIKPKPVCLDATMKKQSTPYEEIMKLVFKSIDGETNPLSSELVSQEFSVVSSSSSTASRENALMDTTSSSGLTNGCNLESKQKVVASVPQTPSGFADGFLNRKKESERITNKVKSQTISRNGRQMQRWHTDPVANILYRMTTGCIPILEDGKILLCSASRKPDWIIPKGGWESDEVMEESAIRETFEEAGVFGIIGPKLSEVEYETRKGKKRRIEFEEVQRKAKQIREAQSSCPKPVSPSEDGMSSSTGNLPKPDTPTGNASRSVTDTEATSTTGAGSIQAKAVPPQLCIDGDNVSVASETSVSLSHIKMSLFPLYVTEVREEWPEKGRFRKVVDIDEAIRISEKRPYFQSALKELKERNLHRCPELQKSSNHETKAQTTMMAVKPNKEI